MKKMVLKEYLAPKLNVFTITFEDVMSASGDITNFDVFDDGYTVDV